MIASAVRERLHYAWIVVGVTFLVMVSSAGMRSIPGVLILPLEEEFGWSRAAISFGVSLNLMLYGMCGPFAAAIMERVGMRTMMVWALTLLGGAVLLATRMTEVWQFQILWGTV